jgi:hypothetical protein
MGRMTDTAGSANTLQNLGYLFTREVSPLDQRGGDGFDLGPQSIDQIFGPAP